jgi:hypothetical protein
MVLWRRTQCFDRSAGAANVLLMLAGFVLAGEQIAAYIYGGAVR